MITPTAQDAIIDKIETKEIEREAPIVAEFVDYLRWLAGQDHDIPLTAGHVWTLFYEGVRVGRVWTEVCYDLELPERDDWY